MDNRCKAHTLSGEQCRLKAGSSGYCHLHDPAKIAEREALKRATEEDREKAWAKGRKLREVIEAVKSTCSGKGWKAQTISLDRTNWRYGTIHIEKSFRSDRYLPETVTGSLNVTVDEEGVRVSPQKTSFHGYGLADLHKSIMKDLGRLSWLEYPSKKSNDKPPQATPPTTLQQLEALLKRFDVAARQLAHRYDDRGTLIINDEYDVQDLLHALLMAAFDDVQDVRPEEYAPSFAGASSRVDFLLKSEKIFIEVKMANMSLKDKKIGEQLIVDIKRYQSHPDCKALVCFVYDPNHYISNPVGLERDLSGKHDDLEVRVLVVPH